MSEAMNLRVLLPMAILLLPAGLIAAPPRESVRSVFPLSSDEECWRKLPPAEKGGGQLAAVLGAGDGRCDATNHGRNAAAGSLAPDAESARAATPGQDAMDRGPCQSV